MRVLVACEESQAVTRAFRDAGHEAWSCDLQACSGGHPEWHLHKDCFEAIAQDGPWELLIAFPPCDHLSAVGASSWKEKQADGRQQAAIEFVRRLYWAPVPRVCIENPQGRLTAAWMPPTQKVHPFHFGDPWMKRTCLWLRNLPLLKHTDVVAPTAHYCTNSRRGGPRPGLGAPRLKLKTPTKRVAQGGAKTAKAKAKTFPGVARAMAAQWGGDAASLGTQWRVDQLFKRPVPVR